MSEKEAQFRLPILHPDFRYRPSENPYSRKIRELVRSHALTDDDTELHAGKWRSQFQLIPSTPTNHIPLHVELGCNAGHVTLEWAKRNPQHLYIGIDWKFKPIFRAAEKAMKQNLTNVFFLRAHSERLHYMFAPEEIDYLYLFFPDPWPKKAHHRNRFITSETLRFIAPILKKGGIFHIKTDHPEYFDWMLEAIKKIEIDHPQLSPWKIIEQSKDLHQNHPQPHLLQIPDVTLFEKLFIKDKLPIHSIKLQRVAS